MRGAAGEAGAGAGVRAERTAATPAGETGAGEPGVRPGPRMTGGRGATPSYRNSPESPLTPGWLSRPPDSNHTRLVLQQQQLSSPLYLHCQGYPPPGYQGQVPPPAPGAGIPAGYPGQFPPAGYHQTYPQQYDRDQGNSPLLTPLCKISPPPTRASSCYKY